jgi:hypothetical protein
MNLPKVDFKRACSKCGGTAVLARWQPPKNARSYWDFKPDWPDEEFIERTCQSCGYKWAEACL